MAAQVTAGVDGVQTRANNNVWGTDDIGVKVKGVSGTTTGITSVMADLYKNVKYSTTANTSDAATFTSNNGIFFQDANEEVTFTAYGPYQQSEANALPVRTESFQVFPRKRKAHVNFRRKSTSSMPVAQPPHVRPRSCSLVATTLSPTR